MLPRCLALLLVLFVPCVVLADSAPAMTRESATVATPQDRHFITHFLQASIAATEAGALATRQASAPELRAYGEQLLRSLGQAGHELGQLVAPLHLPPLPDDPDADHKALMLRLQQGSPAQFDQVFLASQLERQEDLLSVLSIEAATGDQPVLRSFATRQLPVVQELRQRALSLRDRTPESAAVP